MYVDLRILGYFGLDPPKRGSGLVGNKLISVQRRGPVRSSFDAKLEVMYVDLETAVIYVDLGYWAISDEDLCAAALTRNFSVRRKSERNSGLRNLQPQKNESLFNL